MPVRHPQIPAPFLARSHSLSIIIFTNSKSLTFCIIIPRFLRSSQFPIHSLFKNITRNPNFNPNPNPIPTMKASLKFNDDDLRPVEVRAKVPISILGLPFSTGISSSTGDPKSLRFDLSTAFESFPAVRVSYRPNDSLNAFSVVVKSGVGNLGSPVSAPMSMSAEFNLLRRGRGPAFFLHFRPRFGDFSVVKTTASSSSSSSVPSVAGGMNGIVENGGVSYARVNGFPTEIEYPVRGIDGILSGIEFTARSVLPIKNKAEVKFRWGVRVPAELWTPTFVSDEVGGLGRKQRSWISPRDLPVLVMRKISIEQITKKGVIKEAEKDEEKKTMAEMKEVEFLRKEHGMLRKAVEDIRSEFDTWKGNGISGIGAVEGRGRGVDDGSRNWKNVRRTATGKEDVNEELKKALMGATAAAGGN